jgi:hypothetical protein
MEYKRRWCANANNSAYQIDEGYSNPYPSTFSLRPMFSHSPFLSILQMRVMKRSLVVIGDAEIRFLWFGFTFGI